MTVFSKSVQSCQYVPFALFLYAFQQLIFVLLNLIQKAAVVPSKREVTKLDLIREHGRLAIRHWIFRQSLIFEACQSQWQILSCVFGNEIVIVSVNTKIK